MTLCRDTESLVTEAIDESAREVFEMMAGVHLVQTDARCLGESVTEKASQANELAVVLGLSGGLQGFLTLILSDDAAIHWTSQLIDLPASEIDQTVIDAVGELGNMVVGGAKRRLNEFDLTMSLPSVIRAGAEQMRFPSAVKPLKLGYEFDGGSFSVLVALSMQ